MSDIEVAEKKAKKAKISATYEKLQAYVFNIAQQNLNNKTIDEESFKIILNNVKLFDSVEDQTEYFNETCSTDGWKTLIKAMKEYRKITIKTNNPTPVKKQVKKSPKKKDTAPSDNEEIISSDNDEIISSDNEDPVVVIVSSAKDEIVEGTSSDNEEPVLITTSIKDEIVPSDNEEPVPEIVEIVEVVEVTPSVKEEETEKSAKKKSNKKDKKTSEKEDVINVDQAEKEKVITPEVVSVEKAAKKKSNKKK